jgi:hypothetical protein
MKLCATYPKEAMKVYQQKEKAVGMVKRLFHRNQSDDESDAARHFFWSALLTKELGAPLAKQFLDAHEAGNSKADPGTAMDLANDKVGLDAANNMIKSDKFTDRELEKEMWDDLKAKKLLVLDPTGGK